MSIPTSPTPPPSVSLSTKISVELAHLGELHRQVDATEDRLAAHGRQMLTEGASLLDVATALNGGAHPEEDDEHSLWWQLEAWGVVAQNDGTRPARS